MSIIKKIEERYQSGVSEIKITAQEELALRLEMSALPNVINDNAEPKKMYKNIPIIIEG